MGNIFVVITAFATAITAVVAFFSLKNEKEKKRISVLSESIRVVLDGIKNSESKDYVLSNKYIKDIKTIKCYLGLDDNEKIGLDDFEKIVIDDLIKDGLNISDEEKIETKEILRKSYKKIEYFCERMDYLGIISEDKDNQTIILNYFRPTITKSYERLNDLIIKTRHDRNSEDLYDHYTQLYNLAKEGNNGKKHK